MTKIVKVRGLPRGWKELSYYKLNDPNHHQCNWYAAYASSKHIQSRVPEDERYANGSGHVSACEPTLPKARRRLAELAHLKEAAFRKRKIKRKIVYEAQGPRGW